MTPVDWWAVIVGPVGLLGVIIALLRISYQVGSFVTELRAYVKLNDLVVGKLDTRVTKLESRRR